MTTPAGQIQHIIDLAWEARAQISAVSSPEVREAVEHVISDLNAGRIRVAERQGVGQWSGPHLRRRLVAQHPVGGGGRL